jgi:hypothetical protein
VGANMDLDQRKEIEERLRNLKQHNHICLLYESDRERFAVLAALFKFAFKRNDRGLYVNSVTDDEEVVENMDQFSGGIDIKNCCDKRDFMIVAHRKLCKPGKGLNSSGLCTAVEKEHAKAGTEGYDGLTVTLEMTNIAGSDTSLDKFRDHESRFNRVLENNDITGICQYNIKKFPTPYIKYMIFTHPLVIYRDCRRIYEL